MEQGIPTITSFNALRRSAEFKRMESFSDTFLEKNASHLTYYRTKWVEDPFHQWSRLWEYPFVHHHAQKYIDTQTHETDIRILDAGSGVTFFSYFLSSHNKTVTVDCFDLDGALASIYANINRDADVRVAFHSGDIQQLDFEDGLFDILYCISVLEHTEDFESIIREFYRTLKPNGILIVTFDISLDGRSDIPIDTAKKLITLLNTYFEADDNSSIQSIFSVLDVPHANGILSTTYIKEHEAHLLPWGEKRPLLAKIFKRKPHKRRFNELSCCCLVFRKR